MPADRALAACARRRAVTRSAHRCRSASTSPRARSPTEAGDGRRGRHRAHRHRTRSDRARADREHADAGHVVDHRRAPGAAQPGCTAEHRRLRDGLFVALVPEALPRGGVEDRPTFIAGLGRETEDTASSRRSSGSRTHSSCRQSPRGWKRRRSSRRCARSAATSQGYLLGHPLPAEVIGDRPADDLTPWQDFAGEQPSRYAHGPARLTDRCNHRADPRCVRDPHVVWVSDATPGQRAQAPEPG